MRIAICDDEKGIREKIKSLVEKQSTDCHVESFCEGGELLEAAKSPDKGFDIVFLDIQMRGMNGIETARALRKQDDMAVLIFVTAIKEYVFEAFDVSAFHYLIKPIEEQKFMEVFDRAVREVKRHKNGAGKRIFVRTGKRSLTLRPDSILYIENKAKKLEIHTTAEVIEIYAAMSGLEKELGAGFYRCHRGYLVNMAYIAEYSKDSITLSNGDSIYLAKEKYNAFVKTYMRYLRNGVCGNV